ncbi:HlyD family efflux transporter periplasmic adaptor subunit [Pantoea sp. Ap-967]|nr:HlyD family efflux transporter periplasmic adaptor subunit [Pantoea sp. Ap-967]
MTRWRWLSLLVAAGLLLALFWQAWPEVSPASPQRWVRVEPQLLESRLGLVGRLQAAREETLHAPFDGVVAAVLVKDGQQVVAGQPLFTLDTAQLDIQLREAEAERLKAREQLRQLRAWQSGPQVSQSVRALGAARAAVAASAASLAETRRLFERGIVARMEVDSLELMLQAQRQALRDAEQELLLTRARGQGDALRIAEMELANAEARWSGLMMMRARRVVRAPFTGVLEGVASDAAQGSRPVQVGQAMSRGMPMMVLVDLEQLNVAAKVQEQDVDKVREGLEVEVVIAGQVLAGQIEQIGQQARSDTGPVAWYDVLVGLRLPEKPGELPLRLGMRAELTAVVARREQAVVVPVEALQRDEAGKAYVLFREHIEQLPRQVEVTPGLAVLEGVEAVGLKAGFVLLP